MKTSAKPAPTQMFPKSFNGWIIDDIHNAFHLHEKSTHPMMEEWLATKVSLIDEESNALEQHRQHLVRNITRWNEQDLQMLFISHIIWLGQLSGGNEDIHYRPFFERNIKAVVDDIVLQGRVDCIVAKGMSVPKQPFFFLHEYKPERNPNGDPLAQVLAAMIATQHLNAEPRTLHGCYVLGRNWFFVVLDGKDYSVSDALDSTQKEDILLIVAMLRYIKAFIEKYLQL